MRQHPCGQWRVITSRHLYCLSNSLKLNIKNLEMKKMARSEGTNSKTCQIPIFVFLYVAKNIEG
jgi:hypothetical protein